MERHAMKYTNEFFKVSVPLDGVADVIFNSPPVNAVSKAVCLEMRETFHNLGRDTKVRAIVLSSENPKVFCAGSDIKEFPYARKDVIKRKLKLENEAYNVVEQIDKPVIAAIEGITYGGGAELALVCDIRVAGENARFAFPEITLGVVPGTGGMFRLSKAVGLAKAREMMYMGEPISAAEALQWRLVNRIVPAGQSKETAMSVAARIAEKSSLAITTIKRRSEEMYGQGRDECFWNNLKMSDHVFRSEECAEGVEAFISKRPPVFHK